MTTTFIDLAARHGIETASEALSAIRSNDGWTIVRAMNNGSFAVLAISGRYARLIKVLPTLDRARAYNFAINRNN